ncbi:unnamed protein product [Cladocopium goreaui]|uniref:Uncharacterized protein n=1 Tax=Cladocopium goreaui TaxID=2562237 RepID=A0A9P1FR50_9DINO|nr:unnamed protein product [Cladocopium goreaui]
MKVIKAQFGEAKRKAIESYALDERLKYDSQREFAILLHVLKSKGPTVPKAKTTPKPKASSVPSSKKAPSKAASTPKAKASGKGKAKA